MRLGRYARKAVQVIEDRGHTTGTMENSEGQVCLVGAMRKAVAPMGRVKATEVVNNFNVRFGEWMKDNYPMDAHIKNPLPPFIEHAAVVTSATLWNDHVLLTGPEACAWLGKFADAMDPQ